MSSLLEILNTGSCDELCILEALKLLMLLDAYELHKKYTAGQDVPVFVWCMFARDTSENPEMFLTQHLNQVGKNAGVEQVWGFQSL